MSIGPPPVQPPVPTPCIGVCRLDEASGLCLGCARSGEEIAAWAEADAPFKRAVWEALPPRRASLGLDVYRLPWTPGRIAAFVEATLRQRSGRWRLGAEGAAINFAIGAGEQADIVSTPDDVTALTARGALRIVKHEKTIAFAFGSAADASGPEAIGLVLPKGRVKLRQAGGPDDDAIATAHRGAPLLPLLPEGDLPLRFSLRSASADLPGTDQHFAVAERAVQSGEAQMVVETGLGRAELFALHSAGSGPQLDLDAARLAARLELPSGWTLDSVFALGALFHPHRRRPIAELEKEHS